MWISNGREAAIAQTGFNYGRRSVQMLLTNVSEIAFLAWRMSRVVPLTMSSLAGSTRCCLFQVADSGSFASEWRDA